MVLLTGAGLQCIVFYSVSRELLDDISLLLFRFGIFSRYSTTKERLPGKKVLDIYKKLNKEPKKHILHHLIVLGKDAIKLKNILCLVHKKKKDKVS